MVNVSCTLCQVSCSSLKTLYQHVVGQKHRASLVMHGSMEELEQVGRLQYFINTQMKEWSILGLEYVVERKSDTSYIYTCRLCDVVQDCHGMVTHVIDVEHMEKYIYTHHRDLYDTTEYPNRMSHIQALEKVAKMINIRIGNKQVCVESSACSQDLDIEDGLSSEEGRNKNCTLPSVGDDLQMKNEQEGPTNNAGKDKLECSQGNNTNNFYYCNLCGIFCATPSILCEHLFRNKHQKKMLRTIPKQEKKRYSLSFLLRTYLQKVPILGLEYILELKVGSSGLIRLSCQLCGVDYNVQKMVAHILDVYHTELYIKKHHGNLLPPKVPGLQKSIRLKALQDVAEKILKNYGRKEILLRNIPVDDSTMVKPFPGDDTKSPKASEDKQGDMSLYDNQSSSKRRLSPCSERNSQIEMLKKSGIDGPSLAKRSRLSPEDDRDVLPHISGYNDPHLGHNESQMWMTLTHVPGAITERETEFRSINQLLDYLANFVIKNDEDAAFIHKISKNCINALKCFNEEEAEKSMQKPEAPFAHINSPLGIPKIEATESKVNMPRHVSNTHVGISQNKSTDIPKATLPKHELNLPLGTPQNKATNNMPKHDSNSSLGISQNKFTDDSKATLPKHTSKPTLGIPQNKATNFSKVNMPKHDSNSSLGISQNKFTDASKATLPKQTSKPTLGIPQNEATDFSKGTLAKHDSSTPLGVPQNKVNDKVSMPKHTLNNPVGTSQNKSTDDSKATLPKHALNSPVGISQNKLTDITKATLPKHVSNPPLRNPQNKATDFSKVNMPKQASNSSVGISQNKSIDVSKATLPKHASNPPLGTPQNEATNISKVNMPKHASNPSVGISQNKSIDISKAIFPEYALNSPVGISQNKATLPKHVLNPQNKATENKAPQNKATDFSKVNMPKQASNPSVGISQNKSIDVSKAILPKYALNPALGTPQNKATDISKVNMPKHASNPSVGISQNKSIDISKAIFPEYALNSPVGISQNKATLPKHVLNPQNKATENKAPQNKATDFSKVNMPKQASNPSVGISQNKSIDVSKAILPKYALNPALGTPQNKATDISKVNMPKHASNSSSGISEKRSTDVSKVTLSKDVLNPPFEDPQNKATDFSKATLPKPALNPPLGNPQNKPTDLSTLPKQNSKPPLGIPQNKATDLFFNAIKNMGESEVVAMFEKIATMNPDFQGMDIPTVIRFLKGTGFLKGFDSGRLKKS